MVGGDDTVAAGSKFHNGQQWDYGAAAAAAAGSAQPRGSERRPAAACGCLTPAHPCLPFTSAVFDVDVAEGQPPLKLALNRGDNPYLVADRFLEEHGLPDGYK